MTFNQTTDDPFSQPGNPPAVKFETPGEMHTITVRKIKEQNDTKPDGTPKLFDNGDPMKVYLFIGTDEAGEERTLWVRGHMIKAVREAQTAAQLTTMIDTKVTVKFTEFGKPKTAGMNAPKLFKAKVEKVAPAASAAWDQDSDF